MYHQIALRMPLSLLDPDPECVDKLGVGDALSLRSSKAAQGFFSPQRHPCQAISLYACCLLAGSWEEQVSARTKRTDEAWGVPPQEAALACISLLLLSG